ncbi:TetR/AcrR family transcriptional regulator [soil metagenome]
MLALASWYGFLVGTIRTRVRFMGLNVNGPESASSSEVSGLTGDAAHTELPVLDVGVVRERADAARNRVRFLAAAQRLFAERGVPGVTMDDVAAAARVGKGTLYRRFGDKGGLAMALLDQQERELQQQMLTGPAPLGPGDRPPDRPATCTAADRLAAFTAAYLCFLDRALDLVLLSETSTPGARFRTGAHRFWRQHCRLLLEQSGASDPGVSADVLLAALSAEQVRHWLRDDAVALPDLSTTLVRLARTLAAPPPAPRPPTTSGVEPPPS